MSIAVGLWKLLGWLRGGEPRGLRLMAAANLVVIALLVAVNVWQRLTINELEDWRGNVLTSLASAIDQLDAKGALLPVRQKDAPRHILALGRFRTDAIAARAQAKADDAAHVLSVIGKDSSINKEAGNALDKRLEKIRADADALRRAAADNRLRSASSAGDHQGGGRATPVPALSAARSPADEATGADGLPAPDDASVALSIDERQLASEQAAQLDELITAIENFARAPR